MMRSRRRRVNLVDIEELKSGFIDLEFDRKDFELEPDKVSRAALACGETRPEFTDVNHDEFQATPAYLCSLAAGRHLPIDFPSIGGIPMDGGKAVACHAPVPAGQKLTGRTHLHEIYDKKGRSGRMIFIVSRMQLYDAQENHLATTDSRMVIRERPEE